MEDPNVYLLIHRYNSEFSNMIIFGCKCYDEFNTMDNFAKNIIFKKNKYFCCCLVTSPYDEYKVEVQHKFFPILLGSMIDYSIRGPEMMDTSTFGSVIIDGTVMVIFNFVANNLRSGHVYTQRLNDIIRGLMKEGKQRLKSKLTKKAVLNESDDESWEDKSDDEDGSFKITNSSEVEENSVNEKLSYHSDMSNKIINKSIEQDNSNRIYKLNVTTSDDKYSMKLEYCRFKNAGLMFDDNLKKVVYKPNLEPHVNISFTDNIAKRESNLYKTTIKKLKSDVLNSVEDDDFMVNNKQPQIASTSVADEMVINQYNPKYFPYSKLTHSFHYTEFYKSISIEDRKYEWVSFILSASLWYNMNLTECDYILLENTAQRLFGKDKNHPFYFNPETNQTEIDNPKKKRKVDKIFGEYQNILKQMETRRSHEYFLNKTLLTSIAQCSLQELKSLKKLYFIYFDSSIQHAPKLDSLANKTLIDPVEIMKRVLDETSTVLNNKQSTKTYVDKVINHMKKTKKPVGRNTVGKKNIQSRQTVNITSQLTTNNSPFDNTMNIADISLMYSKIKKSNNTNKSKSKQTIAKENKAKKIRNNITKDKTIVKNLTPEEGMKCYIKKVQQIFAQGNFYFVLQNKYATNLVDGYKNYYVSVDAQKLDDTCYMVSSCKRYTSDTTINSDALLYPVDGKHFICPVNVKELKDSGETIYLSQFTVPSSSVSFKTFIIYAMELMAEGVFQWNSTYKQMSDMIEIGYQDSSNEDWFICVEGFITKWSAKRCIKTIKSLKRKNTFMTVQRYDPFLNIQIKGNIFVRYSNVLDMFISPYEYETFFKNIAFKATQFPLDLSSMVNKLPETMLISQPAKMCVSMSNLKGSCLEFSHPFLIMLFLSNVGYNSALVHPFVLKSEDHPSWRKFNDVFDVKDPRDVVDFYSKLALLPITTKPQREASLKCMSFLRDNLNLNVVGLSTGITLRQAIAGFTKRTKKEYFNQQDPQQLLKDEENEVDNYLCSLNNIYFQALKNKMWLIYLSPVTEGVSAKFSINVNNLKQGPFQELYNNSEVLEIIGRSCDVSGNYPDKNNEDWIRTNFITNGNEQSRDVTLKCFTMINSHYYNNKQPHRKTTSDSELEEKKFQKKLRTPITVTLDDTKYKLKLSTFTKLYDPSVKMDSGYKKFHQLNPDKPRNNHIKLWVGFGDINGFTDEEGLIMDKKLVTLGPKKLISVTLNVKFVEPFNEHDMHFTSSKRGNASVYNAANLEYYDINKRIGDTIYFGMVSLPKNNNYQLANNFLSKAAKINVLKIIYKSEQHLLIFCHERPSCSNQDIKISSYYNKYTGQVLVHYHYYRHLGVGIKVANMHGQKNIIPATADLSKYRYYTRNGECVHPQLLYSPKSIIGRTVSSQIKEMLSTENVAIDEKFNFIGKISVMIHHLEDTFKSKRSESKIDIMTMENCYMAKEFTTYAHLMKNNMNHINKSHQMLSFLNQIFVVNNFKLSSLNHLSDYFNEQMKKISNCSNEDDDVYSGK